MQRFLVQSLHAMDAGVLNSRYWWLKNPGWLVWFEHWLHAYIACTSNVGLLGVPVNSVHRAHIWNYPLSPNHLFHHHVCAKPLWSSLGVHFSLRWVWGKGRRFETQSRQNSSTSNSVTIEVITQVSFSFLP